MYTRYTHITEVMVPRVNIYLSDELDKAVREAGISISAVCQRALEKEVRATQAAAAVTDDLHRVVARLAKTVSEEEQQQFADGRALGVSWARNTATFSELEQIANMDPRSVTWGIREGEHSLWESFVGYAAERGHSSMPAVIELEANKPFTHGLFEGATEVYEAVKDRVRPA
jgi:post-segregation antitoxin (ccd killing protein)